MKYKVSTYAKIHGVTMRTVWNWINKGELEIERTSTGRVRIVVDENKEKTIAVYARVSSSENKSNLIAQKDRVVSYCMAKGYKISKVVMEVGSGLNDKRPKLEDLLKDNSIDIIVVEHKDRFSRFGFNFIQTLLNINGRSIEVINQAEDDKEDIMSDLISIITSFCSKVYGLRRSKRRTGKIIEELSKKDSVEKRILLKDI